MKVGGIVTTLFLLAGVVLFGIGLYVATAKDEEVIDKVILELKSLRSDMDKEKRLADQFRTDILLTTSKLDAFLSRDEIPEEPKIPAFPPQINFNAKEAMTVKFDRPIQVEIISKPSKVKPPPLPKSVTKKVGAKDARKK